MKASDCVYLRSAVKIEPLANRWPAWPHLISPAQHALNIAFRHIPNLKSFVTTPTVHIAAAEDPSLFGGPFVSLRECDVPDVRRLLQQTEKASAHLIAFAHALREFD